MAGLTRKCFSESDSCSDSPGSSSTALSHGDTDSNGEEKTCAVCGDRATGYHFHAMTCEGCKGFFRRSVIKRIEFTCPFTSSCTITKAKRRQCQACRYQKCLAVGMRKDMIMSDEALRLRRTLRHRKQKEEQSPRGEPDQGAGLTAEQEQLIEILSEAHQKNFDSSFSQFTHYQPPVRLDIHSVRPQNGACLLSPEDYLESYPEEVLPDVFSMVPILAEMSTFMIQQVIQFAKAIPAFRILPIEDQISLLKGTTLEICQIQFNTIFNEETKVWECGQHCYTIQDAALAGFRQIYLEPLLKFHVSLRKLKLHEAEYVLLQALVLFSPGGRRAARGY
ncbi:nuclear receptor subfamily 1 group I member 3 isoform X2 [Anolis carolinensis]|uniref:nuclear receptor subfamily 1 group I member 3 isoform X2 n=1 Tax=Anolis carolinensis TaxID=28377 RepID=UPI0007DB7ECA|nr:PREDICTED: nuclear receptor subfamily 1 group I member 2 isoform X2 [Anolis carolinensis]|eukprot:XP_016854766.1 PREDICTED: nuclear receptor subfamily 1 group I member 2 isoform X2 [Anolis carolinensis]